MSRSRFESATTQQESKALLSEPTCSVFITMKLHLYHIELMNALKHSSNNISAFTPKEPVHFVKVVFLCVSYGHA
jgi:hypothetical protein